MIATGGDLGAVDIFDAALSGYTGGIGPSLAAGTFDLTLNDGFETETSLSTIFINAAANQATNSVHKKINGVVPDELLSPSGEIYKGIFKSSAQGFIDASVNN